MELIRSRDRLAASSRRFQRSLGSAEAPKSTAVMDMHYCINNLEAFGAEAAQDSGSTRIGVILGKQKLSKPNCGPKTL
jgi:hypothetical protein